MKTLQERIEEKLCYMGDCVIWTGCTIPQGYGQIYLPTNTGRMQLVHRVMYKLHYGSLDDTLQLDHICRNRICVNPGHLEPVSQSVNMKRAYRDNPRPKPIYCRKGHEYTDSSTIHNHGTRQCRICYNKWQREYRHAKRNR